MLTSDSRLNFFAEPRREPETSCVSYLLSRSGDLCKTSTIFVSKLCIKIRQARMNSFQTKTIWTPFTQVQTSSTQTTVKNFVNLKPPMEAMNRGWMVKLAHLGMQKSMQISSMWVKLIKIYLTLAQMPHPKHSDSR